MVQFAGKCVCADDDLWLTTCQIVVDHQLITFADQRLKIRWPEKSGKKKSGDVFCRKAAKYIKIKPC